MTGYDVQEDKETGHCRGCGCSIWTDQDLCDVCDCYGDLRRLADILRDHLTIYPQAPLPRRDQAAVGGADITTGATP